MHISNLITAWAVEAQDALTDCSAKLGTDARELAVLTLTDSYGSSTADWLRTRIGLTQSGTVRLIDRLEEKGWIKRHPGPGRSVTLSLTANGRKALKSWRLARDEAFTSRLESLSATQRATLAKLLSQMLSTPPRERIEADRTCSACEWPACGADCPVDRSVINAGEE